MHTRPPPRALRHKREPQVARRAREDGGGFPAASQPRSPQRHRGQVPQGDQGPAARQVGGGGGPAAVVTGEADQGADAHDGHSHERCDGVRQLCLLWPSVRPPGLHRGRGVRGAVDAGPEEHNPRHCGDGGGPSNVVWVWKHRLEGRGALQDGCLVAGRRRRLLPRLQLPGARPRAAHVGRHRRHPVPRARVRLCLGHHPQDLLRGDLPHARARRRRRRRAVVGADRRRPLPGRGGVPAGGLEPGGVWHVDKTAAAEGLYALLHIRGRGCLPHPRAGHRAPGFDASGQ
mmetsp:Transcript_24827/g.57544  ORF Transcript_24827/g.57544 Transcript_24827/m.57544 type:complete len:288 (+) Transcript_24827:345-1208(+)